MESKLLELFLNEGIQFYTGVPDSVLKSFCFQCERELSTNMHLVAANEGSAIGLAVGHFLGTGKPAVVYMQNSGLGNAINPLLSSAHSSCYGVPMILVIGWRGSPDIVDEPQHQKMGSVTLDLLKMCDIPVVHYQHNIQQSIIAKLVSKAFKMNSPVALLVKNGDLSTNLEFDVLQKGKFSRKQFIKKWVETIRRDDLIVASTGFIARESYEELIELGYKQEQLFMCTGAMGHASQVALGIATTQPQRNIWCLDGDGAFCMHMGGAATIGTLKPPNLKHLVFNNGTHSSVGGTKTTAPQLKFSDLAKVLGYDAIKIISLEQISKLSKKTTKTLFAEIIISGEETKNLPRPDKPLAKMRDIFMKFIQKQH